MRGGHQGADVYSAHKRSIGKRRKASCARVRAAGQRRRARVVLAEQAKILVAEAGEQFRRHSESVAHVACASKILRRRRCALGWACWRTYLGRPEVAGSARRDDAAWERFGRVDTTRTHCRAEASWLFTDALATEENFSACRPSHYVFMTRTEEACDRRTYTWTSEAPWRENESL